MVDTLTSPGPAPGPPSGTPSGPGTTAPVTGSPTAAPAAASGVGGWLARQAPERLAWYRSIGIGLGAFVVSRLIVFAGVYARAAQEVNESQARFLPLPRSMREMIQNTFLQWDGKWYRMITANGYPRELDTKITYIRGASASVAFFPVYPMLARGFNYVFPGGVDEALLGVNVVLSVIAVVLVGLLARDLYDIPTATRAMILFCLFPGSVTLSWSYAEPSLIVCAAACFLCMQRERWVLAGLFAAIGTATRPNGIGLVAACVVAAAVVIWRKRQWRSLIAVVLSPAGVLGYHFFLTRWTGESGAWMRAQREAWNEGWSWGATAVRFTWRFLENPLGTYSGSTYMHTALALLALVIGLYCAIRTRVPLAMLAYVAVVAFLMIAPSTVSARPRFVFAAFPLVLGVARWWPRRNRYAFDALVVLSAGSLVAFTMIYASWAAIP